MSRSDLDRLYDIAEAIEAIRSHVDHGPMTDVLVFDAVRMRLLEIGEAVKALTEGVTESEPEIPWRTIARSRDHLAHRYFASEVEILTDTVTTDLEPLHAAVTRLIGDLTSGEDSTSRGPGAAPV
ncbi:HepT-like ribonuclease domain-containing protein [Nocardioides sp. YIM 152588]|uniref:HepT-like ribonuclease domain-containing protein n=1 Tax=Nocardioides sp. YIM 152588 TaxID=3158259 RepID=UPI0032E47470